MPAETPDPIEQRIAEIEADVRRHFKNCGDPGIDTADDEGFILDGLAALRAELRTALARAREAETRTEYVVYIPDDHAPDGRRQVRRYAETEDGESGETLATEHVAWLHQLAKDKPKEAELSRRAEAFAVRQAISVAETPLAARTPLTGDTDGR